MARNNAGTYSLPAGNPVVSGTTITASWANTTVEDIETALTDSMDRQGRGSMLSQFKAFDGTAAAPGISWASETSSGWYYAGAGDFRFSLGGTDVLQFKSGTANLWDGSAWNGIYAQGETLTTDTINSETGTITIEDVTIASGVVTTTGTVESGVVKTDTINESTAAAGITVDGVLLKDTTATVNTLVADTISEKTSANGVTIDGVLLKDGEVTTDTINEETADTGVTVDGLLIKDSSIPEAAVTEHQAALSITESQVSDLGTYATTSALDALLPRNSDTTVDATTSRTLASTDEGDDIVFSSASAVTVTVPGTLSVGFQCSISRVGAGAVTLTSVDNLNGAASDITLPAQWTTVWLMQYSEGNWLVSGA